MKKRIAKNQRVMPRLVEILNRFLSKLLFSLLILTLPLFLMSCSNSGPPKEPSKIKAFEKKKASKISTIRIDNIKQTARGLGAQASLAKRSYQLNRMMYNQRKRLDNIFNFNYLILNKNVLPPILAEGRNTLNLSDDFTIRVSDHEYKIIQPPRFITAPPNWRHYIWMRYKKPEEPNATLLPQNDYERKMWNKYLQIGWNEGITQADQIFAANLARLKRDYKGMLLYRKLLAQNIVTKPYVSQAKLGITGDGNDMHINDRVLRITSIPQLQTNPQNWRPVITEKEDVEYYISETKNKKIKIK